MKEEKESKTKESCVFLKKNYDPPILNVIVVEMEEGIASGSGGSGPGPGGGPGTPGEISPGNPDSEIKHEWTTSDDRSTSLDW
ncbi:hypothetical protein GNY06_02415 [Elizabethkingia argentiflava]|uniref:Uncharacterized protein n=1 Tax=Elizabethkingia argenteiflava TaxID=2681556 RepID=A0A845PTP1_9FLAO|nr:hypothetical protein [Elizabethkingia argenteiflava]NAW50286.1 hypothetical protein [Elizabethkingia argenteiflava]